MSSRQHAAVAVDDDDDDDDDDDGAATLRKRIEAVEAQRNANDVDLQARLERVRSRTRLRSLISFWYSDLKVVFVRDEMPWLIELGKRNCEWGRRGDEGVYVVFFQLTLDVLSE